MSTPAAAQADPVARVLELLPEHTRSGAGWRARCPAHDDRSPSLSIDRGDDGRALVRCQVGCRTADVLEAIGLRMRDLYVDGQDRPRDQWRVSGQQVTAPRPAPAAESAPARRSTATLGPVVARYPYVDEQGAELFVKNRHDPKTFRVQGPRGARRVLYRLPEVLAAVQAGTTVYVVEGEKDADRLAGLGHVATCNFDGAAAAGSRPKWRPEYGDALTGAHVVIVQDRDEAGAAHAAAAAADLAGKAATVRIVEPATPDEHSDVSDHLDAGHTLDQLRPVQAPAPAATDHAAATPPGGRRLRVTRASDVQMRRVRWLWDRRLPLGGFALLAGREGLGKSTIACDLAAQLTRGELDGEAQGEPRNVIYVHSEDARDYTIVPRLTAAGADLDRVQFVDVLTEHEEGTSETGIVLPRDAALLAETITECSAALVILDAATSVIDPKLDGNSDREMRQGLERIARVAEVTGAAVLGLVHFGKRDTTDANKLILGSSAWAQVVRSVLSVAQDEETGQLVLSVTKSNLGARASSVGARIVSTTVTTEQGPADVGRVEWLGETDRDARDILGGPEVVTERQERTHAVGWLEDYLTEQGRAPSADVKREARKADISPRTLGRARDTLNVHVENEGFPRVSYWSLPDYTPSGASTATDDPHARESGTTGTTGADQGEHGGTIGTTGAVVPVVPPDTSTRADGTTGQDDDAERDLWSA